MTDSFLTKWVQLGRENYGGPHSLKLRMRTKFGKKCLEVFIFFDPHMWRLCCLETLDMWLAQALYNHLLMGPDSKLSYASKQRYLNPIPAAPGIPKLSPIPRTVLFNFSAWNETGVSSMVRLVQAGQVICWRIPILDQYFWSLIN